jgi:hypothetical protein
MKLKARMSTTSMTALLAQARTSAAAMRSRCATISVLAVYGGDDLGGRLVQGELPPAELLIGLIGRLHSGDNRVSAHRVHRWGARQQEQSDSQDRHRRRRNAGGEGPSGVLAPLLEVDADQDTVGLVTYSALLTTSLLLMCQDDLGVCMGCSMRHWQFALRRFAFPLLVSLKT